MISPSLSRASILYAAGTGTSWGFFRICSVVFSPTFPAVMSDAAMAGVVHCISSVEVSMEAVDDQYTELCGSRIGKGLSLVFEL